MQEMHVTSQVQILFIFICIMPTFDNTKTKVYPNVGPKACENFCLRTVGCFGFKYSKEFLSCLLPETFRQDEVEPHFVNVPMPKDKDDDVFMMTPPCPAGSRKLPGKLSSLKCRIDSPLTEEELSPNSPKLLLFSQRGNVFQLEKFKRRPLRPYKVNSNMPPRFRSVQYLTASQMLLVLTTDKELIFMPNIGKGSKRLMGSKVIATGITDKEIFYVHGKNKLAKMNQYGQNSTFIKNLKYTTQEMTVDRKNKVILISNFVVIYKYTYTGQENGIFYFTVQKMYFDLFVNVLYAQNKKDGNIFRFDKRGGYAKRPIFPFNRILNNICAHQSRLYMIDKKGVIEVHGLWIRTYRPFKNIRWYDCCIIP